MSGKVQRSFAGGEITPSLHARVDFVKYGTSMRTMRNCFTKKTGGAVSRAGTELVNTTAIEAYLAGEVHRFIPFRYNQANNFVLHFFGNSFSVIKDGVYINQSVTNIGSIIPSNPTAVVITAHGFAAGTALEFSGLLGMSEMNGQELFVSATNLTANTFELNNVDGSPHDSSGYSGYVSGGVVSKRYYVGTSVGLAGYRINYSQSGDVLTVVDGFSVIAEIKRVADNNWTHTSGITPDTRPGTAGSVSAVGGDPAAASFYFITAVNEDTGEEGPQGLTLSLDGGALPQAYGTLANPLHIAMPAGAIPANATAYRVYRALGSGRDNDGVFGFIGTINGPLSGGSGVLIDDGITADFARRPSLDKDHSIFDLKPTAITRYQQRLILGGDLLDVEKVAASQVGSPGNFIGFNGLGDGGPLSFSVESSEINSVKHLLNLGRVIIFTEGSEILVSGDDAGRLTPSDINTFKQSYHGISDIQPIGVGNTALFVQTGEQIVRDFTFSRDFDGYSGDDITIMSDHLFRDKTVVDWAHQKLPNSIVWLVMSDGTLNAVTYSREQEMLSWHRHDMDGGRVINVASIQEGSEYSVYFLVMRDVNGVEVMCTERMRSREITDIVDAKLLDSSLSYDGRSSNANTMTLSGGVSWDQNETMTLTVVVSVGTFGFTALDIGNEIVLNYNSDKVRCEIVGWTSATVVTVRPNKTVPVSLRTIATTDWAKAVDEVSGLWNLEGQEVSVFADGFVVASPYNDSYDTVTVSNGIATLDKPYSVIHVGAPITCDLETLDVDTGPTVTTMDVSKNITGVDLYLESTRGVWVGAKAPTNDASDALEGLRELKIRNLEGYDEPVNLISGHVPINITSEFNSNGRVFIRQVDPVPMTILAIAPTGFLPGRPK